VAELFKFFLSARGHYFGRLGTKREVTSSSSSVVTLIEPYTELDAQLDAQDKLGTKREVISLSSMSFERIKAFTEEEFGTEFTMASRDISTWDCVLADTLLDMLVDTLDMLVGMRECKLNA